MSLSETLDTCPAEGVQLMQQIQGGLEDGNVHNQSYNKTCCCPKEAVADGNILQNKIDFICEEFW